MTPSQLVLCRRIVRGFRLRIGQVKQRLRADVVTADILGLGGRNFSMLMHSPADRVLGFARVVDIHGTQVFDKWLEGVVDGELDEISEPLTDTLKQIAGDAISRNQTPAATWSKMAKAFDAVSKDKAADLAVAIVLAPPRGGENRGKNTPVNSSETLDGDQPPSIHEALIIRNDDGSCMFTPLGLKLATTIARERAS
jgi:hypothetical protein